MKIIVFFILISHFNNICEYFLKSEEEKFTFINMTFELNEIWTYYTLLIIKVHIIAKGKCNFTQYV